MKFSVVSTYDSESSRLYASRWSARWPAIWSARWFTRWSTGWLTMWPTMWSTKRSTRFSTYHGAHQVVRWMLHQDYHWTIHKHTWTQPQRMLQGSRKRRWSCRGGSASLVGVSASFAGGSTSIYFVGGGAASLLSWELIRECG